MSYTKTYLILVIIKLHATSLFCVINIIMLKCIWTL